MPTNTVLTNAVKPQIGEAVQIDIAKDANKIKSKEDILDLLKKPEAKPAEIIEKFYLYKSSDLNSYLDEALTRAFLFRKNQDYQLITQKMKDIKEELSKTMAVPTNIRYTELIDRAYKQYLENNTASSAEEMIYKANKDTEAIMKDDYPIQEVFNAIRTKKITQGPLSVASSSSIKTLVEEYEKADQIDKDMIMLELVQSLKEPIFEAILSTFKYMNYEEIATILRANKKVVMALFSVIAFSLIGGGGISSVIIAIINLIIAETKKEVIRENPSNIKLIK